MAYPERVSIDGVYKTEGGLVFKVQRDPEGHLSVQQLQQGAWSPAPIGIAGLRIAPTTKRLTPRQIEALGA
jgi:hypothetical protein